ncbi:PREDICTED: small membrane A-kinase anchor protein [Chinchilla lanigera]|uniref:small membrane A-kinase anchor protein n=1 Tax=Chinchilla lanigera TaxID=34839 RepID=UPI00038EED88|nr:PREDICTED: small membrane A-kinase anchor protein [Chinchilla lanigera]XP_005373366.1 PREDICTED: small membrane A-kinase anchor protein [Chinchilla lanigera]XP_005373368.1 PREDICTED: small membrane A-kinase anchor protein [Chinchilla lanigera]
MGCMKSKQTFPFPTNFGTERQGGSEESFMREERLRRLSSPRKAQGDMKAPPGVSTAVTEYADRLSREILHDALQQWACNHIKYCDIPYIESEGP